MALEETADDLATLTRLDEQVLVDQLHSRYDVDQIYTYIGDILVAVNPFKTLDIYSQSTQLKYNKSAKGEHPPHIFATADWCYNYMCDTGRDQCCVVSGESGAGKTESAKFIIRHIVDLCHAAESKQSSDLEKKILQVNPLLEAFGNAQTIMNDNSSRFGKYTELVFNNEGHVLGARISEYLLEKSRVVRQRSDEQNFHIFYYIFASPDTGTFGLEDPESYNYLSNVDGVDVEIEEAFREVVGALYDVGFSKEEQDNIFALLGGILQLGNIGFQSKGGTNDAVGVHIDSTALLDKAASLFQVDVNSLKDCLETTMLVTRDEKIKRTHNEEQAFDTRDATAKGIYGRLFGWLIGQINILLAPPTKRHAVKNTIGILDIFGFENFQHNSFEQWCINLANEQLQHFFNQHIFALELAEYEREGIDTINISYVDNKPLLDLFLQKPMGLFAILDEESLFPSATSDSLVQKMVKNFSSTDHFQPAKNNDCIFTIKHYAGDVVYNAKGWLDKNRDSLSPDVVACMQASKMSLLSEIFLSEVNQTGNLVIHKPSKTSRNVGRRQSDEPERHTGSANRRAPSVGRQFTLSLSLLVEKMTACRPHFVRCIKPNTGKEPDNFDDSFVLIQLNYTGMLETTRIRREGYAVRPKFAEFVKKYKVLGYSFSSQPPLNVDTCERILKKANVQGWLLGKTKIFLKYYHVDELDKHVAYHHRMAAVLQKCLRGAAARKRHEQMVKKAEEQRKEAARFFDRMITMGQRLFTSLESMCDYDIKVLKDLALQEEQKRRQEAAERQRQAHDRQQRERQKQEEELQTIKRQMAAKEEEVSKMKENLESLLEQRDVDQHQIEKQESLVRDLEAQLREQSRQLEDAMAAQREAIAAAKQTLKEREVDLNSQLLEREGMIRELTTKVIRGENVKETVREMKDKLRQQESQLDERRFEVQTLNHKMELQLEVLETTKSAHDRTVKQLNELLVQKESLTGKVRRELDSTRTELEKTIREKEQLQDQVEQLERTLKERDTYIQEIEDDLESHQNLLKRAHDEAEQQLGILRKQLQEAEQREMELQLSSQKLRSTADSHRNEAEELRERVRQATEDMSRQGEQLRRQVEAAKADADDRVREEKERSHKRILELEDQLAEVKLQVQQRDVQLRAAVSEKETIVAELTSKVERGEAEAAAELRSRLRQQVMEIEEKEADIQRLQSKLSNQQSLMAMTQTEHESIVSELRRLLSTKDELANTRHEEHDKEIKSMQAKLRQAKQEAEQKITEAEDELSKLKLQLRQKDNQIQTEQADKQHAISSLEKRLEASEAQIESERTKLRSVESRLSEKRSEIQALQEKLDKQFELLQTTKAAHDQLLQKLTQTQTESAEKAERMEDEARNLRSELDAARESSRSEIERIRKEEQALRWSQQEEQEARLEELQAELSGREREVSELQMEKRDLTNELESATVMTDQQEALLVEQRAKIQSLEESLKEAKERIQAIEEEHLRREDEQTKSMAEADEQRKALEEEIRKKEESEKQNLARLSEAIRLYGRKGDDLYRENTDLVQYVTLTLKGIRIPADISVSRFHCKGFVSKSSTAKGWQKRWLVFDLEQGKLIWYQDKREMKINVKGNIPMKEVAKAVGLRAKERSNPLEFAVHAKRNHQFRAPSKEARDVWIKIINSVSSAKKTIKGSSNAASSSA